MEKPGPEKRIREPNRLKRHFVFHQLREAPSIQVRADTARWSISSCICLIALLTMPNAVQAIAITLDYRFDTNGFFSDQGRRNVLNAAAQAYFQLSDNLAAIAPSAGNTWQASFADPTTGNNAVLNNLNIPAKTIVVFVGARDMGRNDLADSAFGGVSAARGTQQWIDTVKDRGQPPGTDFGPWGGALSFNSNAAISWNFNLNAGPAANQIDALAVATHELAHVLGYGEAASWDRWIKDYLGMPYFYGPLAFDANQEFQVPLAADRSHWNLPEPDLMNPVITSGERLGLSALDVAGLCDIGWTTTRCRIPEPGTLALTALGFAALVGATGRMASRRVAC